MPLEEYKELVATAASVTTIAQFFSPVLLCKKIIQNGSTKGVDPMPFLGGMAMSVLFLQYGFMLNDSAMTYVNVFGLGLNLAYSICFYLYTAEKFQFLSSLGKVSAVVAVLIGYTRWEQEDLIEYRFGLIVTVLLLALIGAPLFSLGDIIRTKSVESLPFPLIASGTVVGALWLLYGVIIENFFMQVQNSVALILCLIQLSLFAIYPSTPPKEDKKEK